MPDLKISQLPAATTPLAGTELVPIVQSGTTDKVTVADLTAGRAVSASALTASSGNLTFSGTAQRITGDMSNATVANRLAFQTSTVNGNSGLFILPNGTGTTSSLQIYPNSDPTNSAYLQVRAATTLVGLNSAVNGTGTFLPMTFETGGSERMRIDTSGNVGIGTTSPVSTLGRNITLYNDTTTGTVTDNSYLLVQSNARNGVVGISGSATSTNAVNFITGGSAYSAVAGDTANQALFFRTGGSTERMRIDSSGNVGIGTASPVNTAGYTTLQLNNPVSGGMLRVTNGTQTYWNYVNSAGGYLGMPTADPLIFQTNNTDRMRITATGNIVAGASAALATNATDGFLYVPTCAGTPTGTPTAITGMAPIVVNTTNNKLYFYSGGAWRDAGP